MCCLSFLPLCPHFTQVFVCLSFPPVLCTVFLINFYVFSLSLQFNLYFQLNSKLLLGGWRPPDGHRILEAPFTNYNQYCLIKPIKLKLIGKHTVQWLHKICLFCIFSFFKIAQITAVFHLFKKSAGSFTFKTFKPTWTRNEWTLNMTTGHIHLLRKTMWYN